MTVLYAPGIDATDQLLLPNVFNFRPSNTLKTRVGKQALRSGFGFGGTDKERNMKIAFVGDSTMLGLGGLGGPLNYSLRNSVTGRLGRTLAGRGLPAYSECLFGTGAITRASYDNRFVQGSWIADNGAETLGGVLYKATSAATLSFTPDVAFDKIELLYAAFSGGGTFTVNVDGGSSLGTINCNQGTALLKSTLTVSLGTHTINCVWASGTALLAGIIVYNSATKGALLYNFGRSGGLASHAAGSSTPWAPVNAIATYAPDLTILNFGINEMSGAVSTATFKTNMQTFITAAKAVGDVWLRTCNPCNTANIAGATQTQFVTAIFELAAENDLPLFDLYGRWGSFTSVNSIDWMADQYHPTGRGYGDQAEMLANLILAA